MSLKGPTVTFAKQENFQTSLTRSVSSQASWLTIQEHRNLQCTIWLMEGVETTRCLGTAWTGHWRMPSAWLLLLWTSTLPPLPLRTLSLPCKSTSLHPHFHFNFKKIPFPPQTAGSASVSRPWSLSGLLFFLTAYKWYWFPCKQWHTLTHARKRCTTASVVHLCTPAPTSRHKRWPLGCLETRTNCSDVCLNTRPMTVAVDLWPLAMFTQ